MKNDIGLKNIALELNLSVAAVSRALKDCDDIGEATKRKVISKAIEFGYVPAFKERKMSHTIAVFVDSLKSPYFGMIIENMIDELKKKDYRILLIPTYKNYAGKENFKEALSLGVDGIITFILPREDAYQFALLYRMPVLLFGRFCEYDRLNVVCADDYNGGRLACEYLVREKKAKRLCYIGVDDIECSDRRKRGFIDRAKECGIAEIRTVNYQSEEQIEELLNEDYRWFFCFDDHLANILLGFKSDESVNVVGFNGTSLFYEYINDVTSVKADYPRMIRDAVEILLNRIAQPDSDEKIMRMYEVSLYLAKDQEEVKNDK